MDIIFIQWNMIQPQKWIKNFAYQNMGDPWKHYVEWMKPVTKDHILYEFIYVKSSIVKYIETESRLVIPSSWDKMGK